CCAVRPALAGSQPGQIDPLQGLAEQAVAGNLLCQLRDPRGPGSYPGSAGPYAAASGMRRSLHCSRQPDAVLHPYGEDQTRSGEGYWLMKKQLIALMFALLPGFALAAGPSVHLDKANIDLSDKAALQDGARTFVNYCMGCHSAQYQRYERVATDLGIPEELMMENLVFTDALY